MASLDITKLPSKKKIVKIKPLKTPRSLEQELANFNRFMINTISDRFKTQVIDAMNKGTIDKFADAQVGNYAKIFQQLLRKFKKSINSQFNTKRIRDYITKLYARTNTINDSKFYSSVQNGIGVDAKAIIGTDGLNSFINAKSLETSGQLVKLKNDMIETVSQNTLRLMSAGKSLDTLYEEVTNTKSSNLSKSELVARNELKAFNSQLNDKRAMNLGVTKAVWNAVGDERSRPCHKKRDGMEYDIEKGLYLACDGLTIKPGEEINCRCFATYVVEFD